MSSAERSIPIPDDLSACQALVEQLAATIGLQTQQLDSQAHEIESHAQTIVELEQRREAIEKEKDEWRLAYLDLIQRAFRRRAERYLQDPNQLSLDFGSSPEASEAAENLAEAVEEAEQTIPEHTRRRRRGPVKPSDEEFPEHIERYEVEAKTSGEQTHCPEHGGRKLIGYDTTKTLEIERPKLRVRVTKYPKFVCEGFPECGVASPERPTGLVEGNRYGTSVAAEVITAKYGFHLPTYRQQDIFAGGGWTPSRSTLLNLLSASGFVVRPLVEHFKGDVLASGLVGTDDTPVTLLLPREIPKAEAGDRRSARIHEVLSRAAARGEPSVSARIWAYRSITLPLCVFDFTVSRHRDGPEDFLEGFSGTLMADCYAGYESLALGSPGAIVRAACGAHARRKVFDARDGYPLEASTVLAKFQQLYDIEDRAKTFSADDRLALRREEAAPVWASLGEWLAGESAARILPKSRFGGSLGYLSNHWDALQVYLSDGRLPIDNNDVEQLMKQVALGRKNWLFIGSIAAGQRAADFLSLVSSAVRNDLDVWAYIKDVLDQLLAGSTDYHALRPDVWRQSHPEAVRVYRTEERRDRADRKQRRRARRRAATTR